MATRRPNIANAGVELIFVGVAVGLGAITAPIWALVALVVIMTAYWAWSRRRALAEMAPGALIGSAAISIVLLAAVLTGAFLAARSVVGWMQ